MVGVAGIPLDENSSFLRGPALAPAKIREAFHSDSSNYFTESEINLKDHTGWKDTGDLAFNKGSDSFELITDCVSSLLSQNEKLFLLGGDHSITFPIVRGFHTLYNDLTILHIDAHGDLYDDFDGNPHSHASPFARIMERGLAKRLVQTGIRTMNRHQREQARRFSVEVIEMKNWSDSTRFAFDGPVYLSFDMDAIDPAFAPGVSHYEPGGFTTRQVLSLLQNLKGNFVGADLVEFNPERDPSGITGMLTGKLFKEILDLLIRS